VLYPVQKIKYYEPYEFEITLTFDNPSLINFFEFFNIEFNEFSLNQVIFLYIFILSFIK
jgi:hypothetical protein